MDTILPLDEIKARLGRQVTCQQFGMDQYADIVCLEPLDITGLAMNAWNRLGEQEMFGFIVRALGDGGLAYEDDKPSTLAEAMAALEKALVKWFSTVPEKAVVS
jgi:hypothetical protein